MTDKFVYTIYLPALWLVLVARQLGHSSHQMIFKTYGRIIKQINGEKNELDKFIYA